MALPLIPIAAQIARVIATKGIRAAVKKFGKDVIKKNADKVPQLVRAKNIREGAKEAERIRNIKIPVPRGARRSYPKPPSEAALKRGRKVSQAANIRRKEIARGERPDRMSLLGRKGFNFSKGGGVGVGKAKKGFGKVMKGKRK
jgi:hypothetical protein